MMSVCVHSLGLVAPGLSGWENSRGILDGEGVYKAEQIPPLELDLLRANERRRLTPTIELALYATQDALSSSPWPREEICSVFASSNGDLGITDNICSALSTAERLVSPVQFHNSVHNAPAGYWAIASGSRMPSTSISAGNVSFSAGVVEAVTMSLVEQCPVLLVCYDQIPPFPLSAHEPTTLPFAVALLLSPKSNADALCYLALQSSAYVEPDQMSNPELELMRTGNPAARSMPLLERIALGTEGRVTMPYVNDNCLNIDVSLHALQDLPSV